MAVKKTEAMRVVDKWDFHHLMAEYQLVMDKVSPHSKSIRDIIELKVLLMASNPDIVGTKTGQEVSNHAEK